MQQWEYRQVTSRVLDIGHLVKSQGGKYLDPKISGSDWMAGTWKVGGKDYRRVAKSERGCWTLTDTMLAEMGDAGWELVGTTPVLDMPATYGGGPASLDSYYPDFFYIFKRPKT